MRQISANQRQGSSEEGYMLVAVIFLLFLLILSLSVALPKVREDIQRDRDVETMQRGKQYVRAIQLYYHRFHTYPPNIEALVKTNNIRFLRKRYLDPTTGKADWKPIMLGQNKTPTAMGFFGQPLAGVPLGGTGPGGQNGLSGTNTPAGPGSMFGGGSNAGSGSSMGGSSMGGSSMGGSSMGGSTFNLGSNNSTSGTSSANGTTGTPGSTTDGTDSGTGSSSPGTGNGPTFGGAGIIGFSPASPKQSIEILKKKNHYNEWEFTYNPLSDHQMMTGGNAGTIGQPAGATNSPFGGPLGNGTQPSGSGSGSGSSGSSPSAPTTPTPTPSPTDPGTPSPQP
jgi:type II secretory pathway pseudopilin PulG